MTLPENSPSLTDRAVLRQHEVDAQLAAIHSPLAGARVNAARRLGELRAGVDELIEALQDPHDSVRGAAAGALGSFAGDEGAAEIVDYLLAAIDDPNEKVCQVAIRSLGMLHAQAARPQIEEFLDDPSPYITGAAILALARLEASDLAPGLAGFLTHESTYVRTQAVRAVGLLRYGPAGPRIVEMLQTTRRLRQLSSANEPAALAKRLEGHEDELYSLLNQLVRAAGELRLEAAVPILIEIAQKDVGLRGLAVEALIATGAEVAPELLTSLLADPSVYLRKRLIQLMVQCDYRPALPMLRQLLRGESASTRSAALQAVTALRDSEAVGQVTWMCFHDSNPFVRVQAAQSLAVLDGREALPVLLSLSSDPNLQVRREAAARLLEWEAPGEPALVALARYARDFPEDELSASIAEMLRAHSFDPARAAAPDPAPAVPVPPDARALLARLEQWRQSLQTGPAQSDAETQKIDAALSVLIEALTNH